MKLRKCNKCRIHKSPKLNIEILMLKLVLLCIDSSRVQQWYPHLCCVRRYLIAESLFGFYMVSDENFMFAWLHYKFQRSILKLLSVLKVSEASKYVCRWHLRVRIIILKLNTPLYKLDSDFNVSKPCISNIWLLWKYFTIVLII